MVSSLAAATVLQLQLDDGYNLITCGIYAKKAANRTPFERCLDLLEEFSVE